MVMDAKAKVVVRQEGANWDQNREYRAAVQIEREARKAALARRPKRKRKPLPETSEKKEAARARFVSLADRAKGLVERGQIRVGKRVRK